MRCGRKVAVSGRSMINVVNGAANLGYLNVPDNVLVDIEMIRNYPANEMVIVTTGSQGEPMSAPVSYTHLGEAQRVKLAAEL